MDWWFSTTFFFRQFCEKKDSKFHRLPVVVLSIGNDWTIFVCRQFGPFPLNGLFFSADWCRDGHTRVRSHAPRAHMHTKRTNQFLVISSSAIGRLCKSQNNDQRTMLHKWLACAVCIRVCMYVFARAFKETSFVCIEQWRRTKAGQHTYRTPCCPRNVSKSLRPNVASNGTIQDGMKILGDATHTCHARTNIYNATWSSNNKNYLTANSIVVKRT